MNGREPYLTAAARLLAESGCTVRSWRKSTSGIAYTDDDDWGIEVPEPRGPVSFGTFAHEVGHQMLRHAGRSKPRWLEEVEAWEYAVAQFDRLELPGKDRAIADALKSLGYTAARVQRRRPTPATLERLADTIADFARRHGQNPVRSGAGT